MCVQMDGWGAGQDARIHGSLGDKDPGPQEHRMASLQLCLSALPLMTGTCMAVEVVVAICQFPPPPWWRGADDVIGAPV